MDRSRGYNDSDLLAASRYSAKSFRRTKQIVSISEIKKGNPNTLVL